MQHFFLTDAVDFAVGGSLLTFIAGSIPSTDCLTITATPDDIIEGDEECVASILAIFESDVPVTIGMSSTTTVTIFDDDGTYFC